MQKDFAATRFQLESSLDFAEYTCAWRTIEGFCNATVSRDFALGNLTAEVVYRLLECSHDGRHVRLRLFDNSRGLCHGDGFHGRHPKQASCGGSSVTHKRDSV